MFYFNPLISQKEHSVLDLNLHSKREGKMTDSEGYDKIHILLGEATMILIDSRREVSSETLSLQLKQMAAEESDDLRVIELWKARKWLLQHSVQYTAGRDGGYASPHRLRENQSRLQDFYHMSSSNDAKKQNS